MRKNLFILSVLIFISCDFGRKESNTKTHLPENIDHVIYNPTSLIRKIPNRLNENSGIILYDDLIWTFNDSGGSNKLYAFNFSGQLEKEVEIEDAKNRDWEDITHDKKHIYVGDFGNNNGTRDDQVIYKIKKKNIDKDEEQSVKSSQIKFDYANQESFKFRGSLTAFDCEAMINFNDALYIFTKDRSDNTTTVYKIPEKKGEYLIHPIEKFDVNGLVTGADISPDKSKLALLGYKNYRSFAWLFSGFEGDDFFGGEKVFIEMDKMINVQTEGICFMGNDSLLISCERSSSYLQQVFLLDLNEIE